mmetsp:Transcript_14140/g.45304  ORF Transcript_14140/g.45304 Transcript_14140/m.45304 type:complete len:411 (+) Transcript_14140:490-1722(+)
MPCAIRSHLSRQTCSTCRLAISRTEETALELQRLAGRDWRRRIKVNMDEEVRVLRRRVLVKHGDHLVARHHRGHRHNALRDKVVLPHTVMVADNERHEGELRLANLEGERLVPHRVEPIVAHVLGAGLALVRLCPENADLDVRVDHLALVALARRLGEVVARENPDGEGHLHILGFGVPVLGGRAGLARRGWKQKVRLEHKAAAAIVRELALAEPDRHGLGLVVEGDDLAAGVPRHRGVVVGGVHARAGREHAYDVPLGVVRQVPRVISRLGKLEHLALPERRAGPIWGLGVHDAVLLILGFDLHVLDVHGAQEPVVHAELHGARVVKVLRLVVVRACRRGGARALHQIVVWVERGPIRSEGVREMRVRVVCGLDELGFGGGLESSLALLAVRLFLRFVANHHHAFEVLR